MFIPLSDYWVLVDNSRTSYEIIAERKRNLESTIFDEQRWNALLRTTALDKEAVNSDELKEKILRGLEVAIQKLIRAKQQNKKKTIT